MGAERVIGEPLLDNDRMDEIEGRLRTRYRFPEPTTFFAYVQPVQEGYTPDGRDLPEVAVFAIMSPTPRRSGQRTLTRSSMWYSTWQHEEWLRAHFAGAPDVAMGAFAEMAWRHEETLKNYSELQ